MSKDLLCKAGDSRLCHTRENQVAKLIEQGAGEAQHRIACQQNDRKQAQPLRPGQGIDDHLQHQRHGHIRDLGDDQEQQREAYSPAVANDQLPDIADQLRRFIRR